MKAEVETGAGFQQVLDLFIAFHPPKGAVKLCKYDLGDPETEGAGDLATNELCNEGSAALACAAEFQHIQKLIIRFHNSGHRSAFAQRRDITCDVDGSEFGWPVLHKVVLVLKKAVGGNYSKRCTGKLVPVTGCQLERCDVAKLSQGGVKGLNRSDMAVLKFKSAPDKIMCRVITIPPLYLRARRRQPLPATETINALTSNKYHILNRS